MHPSHILKQLGLVSFLIGLVLFSVSEQCCANETKIPKTRVLDEMCAELIAQVADDCQHCPLDKVAVYYFTPRNKKNLKQRTSEEVEAGSRIESNLMDALMLPEYRQKFQMLNRNFAEIRAVIDNEYNHGIVNQNQVAEIGKVLGAKYAFTGDFWEEDGNFFIRVKLFSIEQGEVLFSKKECSDLGSRKTMRLVLVSLLLLVVGGGGGAVFFLRSQKQMKSSRKLKFTKALAERDVRTLVTLLPVIRSDGGAEKDIAVAESLLQPVKGLIVSGLPGAVARIAPGPMQNIGRGDMLFNLHDPWVSRSGQAVFKVEHGEMFVSHNPKATNQIKKNGEGVSVGKLVTGDVLSFGPTTVLEATVSPVGDWLRLDVTSGADSGIRFILVHQKMVIGRSADAALIIDDGPDVLAEISWLEGRPLLKCSADHWPLAGIEVSARQGEKIALLDGDVLNVGGMKLTVNFVF